MKKFAVLGTSPPACIFALNLKKKYKCKVVIFEKSNALGGAWAYDKYGQKFANVIAPVNEYEARNFKKVLKKLKNFKIFFSKKKYKALYPSKIIDVHSCDLSKLYKFIKNKNLIKFKSNVTHISDKGDCCIVNKKYKFNKVFFPTHFNLKKITFSSREGQKKIPFFKLIKAKHLRLLCSSIRYKNKEKFTFSQVGPLDRFQYVQLSKNLFRINGRVSLNYKKRSDSIILKKLNSAIGIEGIKKVNFFRYESCSRTPKEINLIKRMFSKSKTIVYLETRSIIDFVLKNKL